MRIRSACLLCALGTIAAISTHLPGAAASDTDREVSAPAKPAAPMPAVPRDVYNQALLLFGGRPVRPDSFPETLSGFGLYLSAVGVRTVSAEELTRPNHADVAARLGFREFLPRREWWPRGAALALLSERLRETAGAPVTVRNWWRPAAYNSDPVVGGAKNGDHPTANAVDLDYPSTSARVAAERYLRTLESQAPWLRLSLGLGARTTHIGIGSPRGHREWHYAGWTPAG